MTGEGQIQPSISPDDLPQSSKVMRSMTLELVRDIMRTREKDTVMTQYGRGVIMSKVGKKFEIRLEFGATLYAPVTDTIHKILSPEDFKQVMDHLEQIRKLQLALTCQEWNISVEDGSCVACLFHKRELRPRRRTLLNRNRKTKKKLNQCDVCGNHVCFQHSANAGAAGEYFTMCVDCSCDLNQVEHQLNAHHPDLELNLDRLLLYYTRMTIQLAYYVPHVDDVSGQLTAKQRRNGRISLGTSGLGFVGAALGVAGAASMLTPAGPAVLLAACVTSATSGTLQLTHSGFNVFLSCKEANRLADRIVGWHGLCLGILGHLEQLRRDLLAEQMIFDDKNQRQGFIRHLNVGASNAVWNTMAVGGFTTSRHAMTGVSVTSAMGASYSQALNTSLQGIPVVGAAFSVGCMAMDARSITSALKALKSPSDKSHALHQVALSFPIHIPKWIQSEVQALLGAVCDLRKKQEEQRQEQEKEIIQLELEQEEELMQRELEHLATSLVVTNLSMSPERKVKQQKLNSLTTDVGGTHLS